MSILRMIFREALLGKLNFGLCLVTVTVACAVYVGLTQVDAAARQSVTKLLAQMGFNIMIVPKGTDMERYLTLDFPEAEMPEEHVRTLAKSEVTAEHFVAKLQHLTVIQNHKVIVTGVLPSLGKIGLGTGKKKPLGYDVPAGEAFAGHTVARNLGLKEGQALEVLGQRLKVTRVLEEKGTLDDLRLMANLHDVQKALHKPGRINTIDALGCRCTARDDFLTQIREEIEVVLPDTQVKHYKSIAVARELTRREVDRFALKVFAAALMLGSLAIAALTYLNVQHRRQEIGLLRTVGIRTHKIAALFLGKILLYSLLGAALGYSLGELGARVSDPAVLEWNPWLLARVAAGAPVVGLLFGSLPVLHGLLLDPVEVLREQ